MQNPRPLYPHDMLPQPRHFSLETLSPATSATSYRAPKSVTGDDKQQLPQSSFLKVETLECALQSHSLPQNIEKMHMELSHNRFGLVEGGYENPAYVSTESKELPLIRTESQTPSTPITITWQNINVKVDQRRQTFLESCRTCCSKKQKKHILKDVSGIAKPGRLLGIMGSSGAGKSTLLNVLMHRNTANMTIDGSVRVNGEVIGNSIRLISAYVQQDDLFFGSLKVQEHLLFQARLKLPRSCSKSYRMQRVNEVIQQLGLSKCATTLIGYRGGRQKGISGGERKRLALASEILTNPPVLFCDEPTSGLDSSMAMNVVQMLKQIADRGKTVVCTIHQPSSQAYAFFDDICLMTEGEIFFLGPSSHAVGFPCPKNFNPADHYLRIAATLSSKESNNAQKLKEVVDSYKSSPDGIAVAQFTKDRSQLGPETVMLYSSERYNASWFVQFFMLLWRASLHSIREPQIMKMRLYQTITIAIILGLVFYQTAINKDTIMNINGVLFIFVSNMVFSFAFSVANVFCEELPIFLREHLSHMYRVDTYYLAKSMSEFPHYIVFALIFTAILYRMAGLYPSAAAFFIAVGFNSLCAHAAVSIGYFTSTAFETIDVALTVQSIIIIPSLLFGGFFLNSRSVPVYFKWLQYLSIFKYAYEGLAINEWQNIDYIPGCGNMTCPNNGNAVLQMLGMNPDNMSIDAIALAAMIAILRFISYASLLIRSYLQNQ